MWQRKLGHWLFVADIKIGNYLMDYETIVILEFKECFILKRKPLKMSNTIYMEAKKKGKQVN